MKKALLVILAGLTLNSFADDGTFKICNYSGQNAILSFSSVANTYILTNEQPCLTFQNPDFMEGAFKFTGAFPNPIPSFIKIILTPYQKILQPPFITMGNPSVITLLAECVDGKYVNSIVDRIYASPIRNDNWIVNNVHSTTNNATSAIANGEVDFYGN